MRGLRITMVRHAQASLGASNYDQLSALGERQARRLGAYFAQTRTQFDAVFLGTLARHAQTLENIGQGAQACVQEEGASWSSVQEATTDARLNEYDSAALIAAYAGAHAVAQTPPVSTSQGYKAYFALLRQALLAWMRGQIQPQGMPAYADFAAGVMHVLRDIAQGNVQHALVVSSGGALSSAIAQVLGAPPETAVELNMRMRNTALSELVATSRGFALLTFNTLAHLDDAPGRLMQTYA